MRTMTLCDNNILSTAAETKAVSGSASLITQFVTTGITY